MVHQLEQRLGQKLVLVMEQMMEMGSAQQLVHK